MASQHNHSRIIIEASEMLTAEGALPGLGAGAYVKLSVVDDGEGMDAATLERAREPFFTTKGVGKGLGLGLSISYNIIKDFGGSLTVGQREGGGALFRIELLEAEALNEAAE